ncbi:MAG TPA: hypothetical protein VL094_07190 [Sphingomonadaceae bacterium]|nr:hypothetical protein [Sphingomonadaceae bacterium]
MPEKRGIVGLSHRADMFAAIDEGLEQTMEGALRTLLDCDLTFIALRCLSQYRIPCRGKAACAGFGAQAIGGLPCHFHAAGGLGDAAGYGQGSQKGGLPRGRPAIGTGAQGYGGESRNPGMAGAAGRCAGIVLHPQV